MRFSPITLLFPVVAALAPPSSSQTAFGQWETLHQFDGAAAGDTLGDSVSGAGDVDGDGFDDLIVGAPGADPGGLPGAGSIYVYSGATGALIWQFDGAAAGDSLGYSVSGAGDVDGDGFADFIVGAPDADPGGSDRAGSAYVYSGVTGGLVHRFDGGAPSDSLGSSVSNAGDVDGDGFHDVIVGAPRAGGVFYPPGAAMVYSGATGSLIWQFDGGLWDNGLGMSVSGAGDVDADGLDDLIVGAPWSNRAYVYSGATGSQIAQFRGYNKMGTSVSGAGDVDGDGFDDVIMGDPTRSFGGSACVRSGGTGTLIWRFDGAARGDRMGFSVSGAGDVDGDGTPDLIVGAPSTDRPAWHGTGSAYVYSGATGDLIWQAEGNHKGAFLGRSVSGAGDVNGDGLADVIAAAPRADPFGLDSAGSVYVGSLNPFLHPDARELSATSGVPVQLDIDFPASEAGRKYAILVSAAGRRPTTINNFQIPLTVDFFLRAGLEGWSPSFSQSFFGRLNASGDAHAVINSDSQLLPFVGLSIHVAAVSYDVLGQVKVGRLSSISRTLAIVP